MMSHTATPGPSSRPRQKALAGRGRRSNGFSSSDKAAPESEDLIYSLIEQPCPDPMPRGHARQAQRPLPTVEEVHQEQPTDHPQEPNTHEPASSNKVGSYAHRVKTFFRPNADALLRQADEAQAETHQTDHPRRSTSRSRQGSRRPSQANSPQPIHHPSHHPRLPSSRHGSPRPAHNFRHEPYSSSRRHGLQSKRTSCHERSETPSRTSRRHQSRNAATVSHDQLEALGENLAEVVGDEFLGAFGDFAPKLLTSIQGVVETTARSYRNDLASGLNEQRYHLNATLEAGLSDLSDDTFRQLARSAAKTAESHTNLKQVMTERFDKLQNTTVESHDRVLQSTTQHANSITQAVRRDQLETAQRVDALKSAVDRNRQDLIQDNRHQRDHIKDSFTRQINDSNDSSTKQFNHLNAQAVHHFNSLQAQALKSHEAMTRNTGQLDARMQNLSIFHQNPQLNPAFMQAMQDAVRAVVGVPQHTTLVQWQSQPPSSHHPTAPYPVAAAPVVVNCCSPKQSSPNMRQADKHARADLTNVEQERDQARYELALSQREKEQALDMANLNIEVGELALNHERNSSAAAITKIKAGAVTAVRAKELERDGAIARANDSLEMANLNLEIGGAAVDHERNVSTSAIARFQSVAASEAQTLRFERDKARSGEVEALHRASDAMELVDSVQETGESVLNHERASSSAAISRMQSTAASAAGILRHECNTARAREREASSRLSDAMEFANLAQETADSLLDHERASASAAISQMQTNAASEAGVLRQDRDMASFREREASNRWSDAMEFAISTQETADSLLDHERAAAIAAISRMQTNAASEAACLRQEGTVARAGARLASKSLDDVINTFSESQETADAVLSHERRLFGETVPQIRTTATAENNHIRFGRDVHRSMLDTTHRDLASAKEEIVKKDEDLASALNLHNMQQDTMESLDQATSSTMSAATSEMRRQHDLSNIYKDIEARAKLSDVRAQISNKDREIFNLHVDRATSDLRVGELEDAMNRAGEEVRDASRADDLGTRRGYLERAVGFLMRATVGEEDDEESDSEMMESGEE